MSNQVFRNHYNGGNKYAPEAAENVYTLATNINIAANLGTWTGFLWGGLNASPVPSVTQGGITTYQYIPLMKPSTVDEIVPSSISNVTNGNTYFYIMETGNYHIELTIVWDMQNLASSTYYVGLETSNYVPSSNSWVPETFYKCVQGSDHIGANGGLNPIVQSIVADRNYRTGQRMRVVVQASNPLNILQGPAAATSTNLVLRRNS